VELVFKIYLLISIAALSACSSVPSTATPAGDLDIVVPQDLFVRVNGVTLQYLDWGGKGDVMLFLPGLTHTAHVFDDIAPAFTDRYHVLGLTRRGHGASEKPATGFDLDTLVTDVVAFVNSIGAHRLILVGHSFAGVEIPSVSASLGDRIIGLVFLDAVYDWSMFDFSKVGRFYDPPETAFRSRQAFEEWWGKRLPKVSGRILAPILRSQTYVKANGHVEWQISPDIYQQFWQTLLKGTEYSAIRAPTLAIWANQTTSEVDDMKASGYSDADIETMRTWASTANIGWKQRGIEKLRTAVPNAKVVDIQATHVLQ
jgi:pimeloyl-ACP methyl ester carboxylesterase